MRLQKKEIFLTVFFVSTNFWRTIEPFVNHGMPFSRAWSWIEWKKAYSIEEFGTCSGKFCLRMLRWISKRFPVDIGRDYRGNRTKRYIISCFCTMSLKFLSDAISSMGDCISSSDLKSISISPEPFHSLEDAVFLGLVFVLLLWQERPNKWKLQNVSPVCI